MRVGRVYYDSAYLITQLDNNSGDQAARTGELYTGIALQVGSYGFQPPISFDDALKLLEPKVDGEILRASIPSGFDPATMPVSRDQVLPMIIAAGLNKKYDFISRVFLKNIKRGLRYPNGDSMLSDFNIYIRAALMAGRMRALRLFLPVLDLSLVLNTALIVFLKARNPGVVRTFLANKLGLYFFVQDYKGDPNNPGSWSVHGDSNVGSDILHTQASIQANQQSPTWISRLSNWLYAKYRPHSIQYAFDLYHSPLSYGNPLNDLYRPIIEKEFYGNSIHS